jgi:L-ascorbate metabolism protein UlaG (beta-lactamase superfamily)
MITKLALAAVVGFAALAVSSEAAMDDTIATNDGALQIHAVHHASLVLTWKGKHIFIDPAPVDETGDAAAAFKALPKPDVIIYTHGHFDHFSAGVLQAIAAPNTEIVAPQEVAAGIPTPLQGKVHVLANGDKSAIDGIAVEAVPAYNTTPEHTKFHPKGKGNGYVLTLGGKRVYIAGDTEEAPELAHLQNIDVAFLPMNQPYTLTVEAAAQWVKDFKPHTVYPYHFRNGDGSKSDLSAFKAAIAGASDVKVLDWY